MGVYVKIKLKIDKKFVSLHKIIIVMRKVQSLAVFCGSKAGKNPIYMEHATKVGTLMAMHQLTLIYGGGGKGIMGAVADGVLQKGGNVIGVIPTLLLAWEQQHTSLSELIEVEDMHIRKRMMYEKCDAAIILPGGFGTLDELFEILTWNQLSIHHKKIIILNSGGFYDHLLNHIDKMLQEDFLYPVAANSFTVVQSPDEIFTALLPATE